MVHVFFSNPVVPLEMLYFFSPGLNMGDHQCRLVQCFSGEWSQLHVGPCTQRRNDVDGGVENS